MLLLLCLFAPVEAAGDAIAPENNTTAPGIKDDETVQTPAGVPDINAEETGRPETGTYIRDSKRNGYGLLVIYNNWTMDTVAVLTDMRENPKVAVYLRARDALEIDGIKDGDYSLYFTIGDRWNFSAGKFDEVYGYYHYNDPMTFETDDAGDEIEYTILELDLYEADATNFMPGQFQFPDISS